VCSVALLGVAAVLLGGCASYTTPGGGASLQSMGVSPEAKAAGTEYSMQQAFERKPLASFPAAVAVARVQAPDYRSRSAVGYGNGVFSVLTTRDIETDEQFQRISKLPMIRGVAPLNRLLIPSELAGEKDLRMAAASLQAEMLLLYTLHTEFFVQDFSKPLTVVTLGLSPNRQARVTTTASAVLLDTRSGFVYALAEATEQQDQLSNLWTDDSAVEQTRLRTESAAFDKLVGEFEKSWSNVVAQHVRPTTQPAP
jgi:hypothetical protein